MALTGDGTRICDLNRSPLAAINVDYTLLNNTTPVILCQGIDLAAADRWRAGTGTIAWQFKQEFWPNTTWNAIGLDTEVCFALGSVLSHGTGTTNANKKTTQTATSISAAIPEITSRGAGEGATALLVEIRDEQSGEAQCALSFLRAPPNQKYEFRVVCVHDAGTTNIACQADIISHSVIGRLPDYSRFTSPELKGQYNGILRL